MSLTLVLFLFSFSAFAETQILAHCQSKHVNIIDVPHDHFLMTFSTVENSNEVEAVVTTKSGEEFSRFKVEPIADLLTENIVSLGVDFAPGVHNKGLSRETAALFLDSGSASWGQFIDCSSTVEAEFTCQLTP